MSTVAILTPISSDAKAWVDNNVDYEEWQELGCGIAVGPRMIDDIVDGMAEDGLIEEEDFQIS